MKSGLLGRKLAHSYSPQIHSYLGDYSYKLFEKEPEELSAFFEIADFDCINVTIPYKKDVIPYCAELSECAKKMGAVNTIVRRKDGKLAYDDGRVLQTDERTYPCEVDFAFARGYDGQHAGT